LNKTREICCLILETEKKEAKKIVKVHSKIAIRAVSSTSYPQRSRP